MILASHVKTALLKERESYILERRPGCPAFQLVERCSKSDDSYRKLGEKHTPQHPINDAFPGLQIISFCESSTTWSINAHLVCPSHRWSPRWGHDNLPRTSIGDVSFIFPVPPQANQLQAPFHPISSMKSPQNTPQQSPTELGDGFFQEQNPNFLANQTKWAPASYRSRIITPPLEGYNWSYPFYKAIYRGKNNSTYNLITIISCPPWPAVVVPCSLTQNTPRWLLAWHILTEKAVFQASDCFCCWLQNRGLP